MIEVEGLTKSYRAGPIVTEVLKGVTFQARPGEFVAVMGRSGSGKSTLLNILGLLDRPDRGVYRLAGVDFASADDDTRSRARNKQIGFVFQQFHLLERVSALRNVMLPLLYADEPSIDDTARAEECLAAVELSHRTQYLPGQLSGGEQQRVAIARALVNRPSLILADEPTGNLDERSGNEILEVFRHLVTEGRTLVLITHDANVAARADRMLVLHEGRLTSAEAAGTSLTAGSGRVPIT
jgi:putative ABC transport system ATP-binding protein